MMQPVDLPRPLSQQTEKARRKEGLQSVRKPEPASQPAYKTPRSTYNIQFMAPDMLRDIDVGEGGREALCVMELESRK